MTKVLIVIDAQVDFTTGRLGSEAAESTVKKLRAFLAEFKTDYAYVLATLDSHSVTEFNEGTTIEGTEITQHCILASPGYALAEDIAEMVDVVMEKSTFMAENFDAISEEFPDGVDEIHICGFCTDICVVANALLLRRLYPSTKIRLLEDLCAGTSPGRHKAAVEVMKSALIDVTAADKLSSGEEDDSV